jgi:hypothetical protein
MFIISILSKIIITAIATNGFIRNINSDALLEEDRETKLISVAASLTVFIGTIVLFYFAGVFQMPIR